MTSTVIVANQDIQRSSDPNWKFRANGSMWMFRGNWHLIVSGRAIPAKSGNPQLWDVEYETYLNGDETPASRAIVVEPNVKPYVRSHRRK